MSHGADMHAMKPLLALLLAPGWLFAATPVRASDPCPQLRLQVDAPDVATRIAAFACQENHAWFRTFIDADSIVFSGSMTPFSTSALSILWRIGVPFGQTIQRHGARSFQPRRGRRASGWSGRETKHTGSVYSTS